MFSRKKTAKLVKVWLFVFLAVIESLITGD